MLPVVMAIWSLYTIWDTTTGSGKELHARTNARIASFGPGGEAARWLHVHPKQSRC